MPPPGRPWVCAACGREQMTAPGPSAVKSPGVPRELTLSRTMLLRRPDFAGGPPGEMICRLEATNLYWLHLSETMSTLLGRTLSELEDTSFLDLVHPDDRTLARDEFMSAVERSERNDVVIRVRRHDGQWSYLRFYTQARYRTSGSLDHLRCHCKDITDSIEAEQELRRRTEQLTAVNAQLRQTNSQLHQTQQQLVHSEKLAALGTLAAGMAHEINNPLAVATNNLVLLGRHLESLLTVVAAYQSCLPALARIDPEQVRAIEDLESRADLGYLEQNLENLLKGARRGLTRVAQIVQSLRDFSRVDRAEFGELDVNEALDQCLGLLSAALDRNRIKVGRRYQTIPTLECSAADLNQVFLQILTNAVQAIECKGEGAGQILLATRHDGQRIEVEIEDDGCGIPEELHSRIFDPFFTTKPTATNSGLGLSVCHSIVSSQGGRIAVEPGSSTGTRFRLQLPIRNPRSAGRGDAAPSSPGGEKS